MVKKKPRTIVYRRKSEGKTRYKKRLRLLLSRKPRLVVRITNKKIISQLIAFKTKGDQVLVGVDSTSLAKLGWGFSCKNIPAAYLTGYLLGKKATKSQHNEAVFDLGFKSPIKGNKTYAFLKGALDAGLIVPHSDGIFPSEERITGKHIQEHAQIIKGDSGQYAKYLKNNLDPTKITDLFKKTKQRIDQDA
ncbi:MAG: 50S ribosomal protein L18 [Candidatus Woesearchaeota archaeon]